MSFKEQLKNEILPKTVEYYNSGIGINEAIVKAASDFKLNLDQTDRLLETMNTARVIAHYEKNAEDRTANCDIADKSVVRKMLYGDKPAEKTAGVAGGSEFGDYASYFEADRNYRSRGRIEKAAETLPTEPEKRQEFSNGQAFDKVAKYARDIEMQRKFAEERLAMAKDHVATYLSKIAASLSRGYEPERRYAMFKSACAKICPNVVKSVDSEIHPQIVKDAAPHMKALRRANVVDSSIVDPEITLARDIEEDLQKIAEMEAKVSACRKHENEIKGVIRKYATAVKMANPGPPRPPKDDGKKDDKKDDSSDPWLGTAVAKKLYGAGVPEMLPGAKAVYDYLGGGAVTPEKLDEAVFEPKPKSPKLRDYINNLRRSDLISELYNDDPIISEASPQDVMRAYRMMIQASPEASLNKEVVRAFLRQSINSVAVSPFDAKQLADLDNTLLKNKGRIRDERKV